MTSLAYIFLYPFTLLHLLPTISSLLRTASKTCSLRKIINNHDCQKVFCSSCYFYKVALQIIALLEPGFYEAKFYSDGYFCLK